MQYEVKFLMPMEIVLRTSGLRTKPYGLMGGKPGEVTLVVVNPVTERQRVPQGYAVEHVAEGDVLAISCSGGGGWGDPLGRDPEKVRLDVLYGLISYESALADYGVVLRRETLEVDVIKTQEERERRLRRTG